MSPARPHLRHNKYNRIRLTCIPLFFKVSLRAFPNRTCKSVSDRVRPIELDGGRKEPRDSDAIGRPSRLLVESVAR
jgi:hypothetical protein